MNFLEELARTFAAVAGIIHVFTVFALVAFGVWFVIDWINGKKNGPR